jgi:molybdate transport system substrate-binding protein
MKKVTIMSLLLVLAMMLTSCAKKTSEVYWYCGASMKKPAGEIVNLYNAQGGHVIILTGGSGQLLNKMISSKKGDIYTPASNHFGTVARKKNIIIREWPLVEQTPVFAFTKGVPVNSFNDLWKKTFKLATGNAKSMALGKTWLTVVKGMPGDMQKGFRKNITVEPVNISQTVNYIRTKSVDAGLVFDSVARVNKLPYMVIPEKYNQVEKASLMLVNYSSDKKEAEKFIQFILSHGDLFKKYGFSFTGKK